MATPRGPLKVEARKREGATDVTVDLPEGTSASVSVLATSRVLVKGQEVQSILAENASRRVLQLNKAGHYTITQ